MTTPQPPTWPDFVEIKYSAKFPKRSYVRAHCPAFPAEIHRMLIGCIVRPDLAAELLPAWRQLAERQAEAPR